MGIPCAWPSTCAVSDQRTMTSRTKFSCPLRLMDLVQQRDGVAPDVGGCHEGPRRWTCKNSVPKCARGSTERDEDRTTLGKERCCKVTHEQFTNSLTGEET